LTDILEKSVPNNLLKIFIKKTFFYIFKWKCDCIYGKSILPERHITKFGRLKSHGPQTWRDQKTLQASLRPQFLYCLLRLTSSISMAIIDQCAKLSTEKPLFNLYKVHKKWLRILYNFNQFITHM
jgi:hypothetical protein